MTPATPRPTEGSALRRALQRGLAATEGITAGDIESVEVRRSPYTTSFPLDEITVHLRSGETRNLLRKDLSHRALSAGAALAKPAESHDPGREIAVYRSILPPDLGTARFVTADVVPSRDRYWLFIEHVSGVELYQVGDVEGWCLAAAWFADMHERLAWVAESDHTAPLRICTPDQWRREMLRALEADGGARLQPVAARHDEILALLDAAPRRFVHGDAYASNVLLDRSISEPRVCPVDWERAALGPALLDLAALTAGWPQPHADRIAAAYLEALPASSPWRRDPSRFAASLAACVIQAAVGLAGGAPDWHPPVEHRQDWIGIAITALPRLEG